LKKEEILDKLRTVGFKENESKVLLVLLNGRMMSASQIAKESRIIRNSIYDILKSFVEKGYCNEIETNTILQYQCIDPIVMLDKIEREFNEGNRMRIQTLKQTFNDIGNYYTAEKEPNPGEDKEVNIELVRGFNKHRMEKYIELLKSSKKKILGMYRLRGIVSSELDSIAADFIKKGGELRSIYQVNLNFKIVKNGKAEPASKEDLIRVCENFEKAGEKIRLSEKDIPNMTIFDDEIVFSNITDKKIPSHKTADLIVKNKSNAKYMTDLFEFYWDNGISIKDFKNRK
jgi:sugar-specific transcriptional regulator TrmB